MELVIFKAFKNYLGDSVKPMIEMLLSNKNDGIMIPVPRYPLYSAEIVLKEGQIVGYYLDESKKWNLSIECKILCSIKYNFII